MIGVWRPVAAGRLRAGSSCTALLIMALGCAVGTPAWSACAPGQANCPGSEPQHQAPPPRPQVVAPAPQPQRPAQFTPQAQPQRPPQFAPQVQQQPAPQFAPRVQQQNQPQFAPQRPSNQAPPSQLYRAGPSGGAAPQTGGVPLRQGGPAVTGQSHFGGPPARNPNAAAFTYHGQHYAPFRANPYRWPGGERYRRYGIGARLPLLFILSAYVIADWTDYGLAEPASGYEWVRYGPDILLVDPNTGQIVDGAYSAFAEGDETPAPGYAPGPPPYQAPPIYAGQPPMAAGPQSLGSWGSWTAAEYQENGQPVFGNPAHSRSAR